MSVPHVSIGNTRLHARCRAGGFTLVELLIAVAIAAVLLGVAVPSFQHYITTQRAVALANALVTDIHLARNEALRRAGQVRLVPAGSGWNSGWQVEEAGSSSTLAEHGALGDASLSASQGAAAIAFDPFGAVAAPTGGVRFDLCVGKPGGFRTARTIELSAAGHVQVKKPAPPAAGCA